MFETFNVPAMYVAIQAGLSLCASRRTAGHRDGLMRRCAALSSHLRSVAKPLSLSLVETYGIESGKPVGRQHHVRSHRVRLPARGADVPRDGLRAAISDASSSPRRVASTSSGKLFASVVVLHHHVPRDRRANDQRVDYVGTANDAFTVVSPPVRRYSVRIGGSVLSLATFQLLAVHV